MPRIAPFAFCLTVIGLSARVLAQEPAEKKPEAGENPAAAAEATVRKSNYSLPPGFAGYLTVESAITTKIDPSRSTKPVQPGFLGISLETDDAGNVVVAAVGEGSPAARAGIVSGDYVVECGGQQVRSADSLRNLLMAKAPGDELKLTITRADCTVPLATKLTAVSRPMQIVTLRVQIGLRLGELKSGQNGGLPIEQVVPGSPAARAGLKQGELVTRFNGEYFTDPNRLGELLAEKNPGDTVTVGVRRRKWTGPIAALPAPGLYGAASLTAPAPVLIFRPEPTIADVPVQLAGLQTGGRGPSNWDDRLPNVWNKEGYKLAVIMVEYPDTKHSDKTPTQVWTDSFFSTGTYTGKNSLGQQVFGSLNDYFREQSFGKLRVEGKVFDWIEVSKKRVDYQQGTTKTPFLTEALDKLLAREGKDALKDFDGLMFIYAGGRVPGTNRGALYWPHRANVTYQNKRWPYFIVDEGGDRMQNISVFCHEFGHMLGLPDLYARPEAPGSEGLGLWCAMSNQAGGGRPQHFSAWCKEQLGWISPAVIDPTVKQKLILAPVEESPRECFKVLVRPDGSEYLLLESRAKKGFDESIPADGLLIWRVVQRRPVLEESHGVAGPAGPQVFAANVPYPSAANSSFTPYTTPSSRSQLGGGLPVYISNIRRLDGGRIGFEIGYEYQ